MAVSVEFRIPIESRVRLKGDYAKVYQAATAGAQGVVKNHRVDPMGFFPMVYIRWDRNHWTYQGERDMWTYESHFDIIEDQDMPKDNSELLRQVAELLNKRADEDDERDKDDDELDVNVEFEERDEEDKEELIRRKQKGKAKKRNRPNLGQPNATPDEYLKIVNQATESAIDAEAFILISVENVEADGGEYLAPKIYMAQQSLDAGLGLQIQVVDVGSTMFQALINQAARLNDLVDEQ